MALLDPKQIYEVLKSEKPKPAASPENLKGLLEQNGLSPNEVLEQLSHQLMTAETPATRLRAAEIALRLNGLLDSENTKPDFHVTINILDSEFSSINPILLPR